MTYLAIAIGGAAGAVCRYVVDFAVSQRTTGAFPWGTWLVNVTGSLLLGAIAGLTVESERALWQVGVTSGFCGAYTTFSTYMHETVQLIDRRAWWEAAWNLTALAVGVAAAGLGWALAMVIT